MADYGQFKFGNTVYPLTASLASSFLKDANPPLYYGLDYLSSMLQIDLGARWNAVVVAAELPELDGYVVKCALPYDPMPELLTQQVKFPLFALWEKESITEKKSFSWYHAKKTWNLLYALPPLSSGQKEQIYPALYAADAIIRRAIEQGYDPNYQSGLKVWDAAFAGVEKIQLSKSTFGNLPFDPKSNLFLPTLFMTIELSVREQFNRSFLEDIGGADVTQQLDGYNFIDINIDLT